MNTGSVVMFVSCPNRKNKNKTKKPQFRSIYTTSVEHTKKKKQKQKAKKQSQNTVIKSVVVSNHVSVLGQR